MRAKHDFGRHAFIYAVKKDGRTILYAHDTGYFYDEVFDFIEKSGFCFDLASFDCTNAHLPSDINGSHMGFDKVGMVIERLRDMGALREDSVLFVNHFSHNGNPMHEDMERTAATLGCKVSYDGCKVDF
jgi:phosphoribosyl 1,2-cyclic phosphate phosphodiesterase